jgi:16S rRNA (cytidine1402-2'-O)-methyltransferase
LLPYHDHSDPGQDQRILAALAAGKNVALISDAGTPLIADPGYRLVRAARAQGCDVQPIPGPCAAIVALSAAGLPSDRFAFEGFLPAKANARRNRLQALASEPRTLIFYEAPHRIADALADLCDLFGAQREAVVARELTKTFETFLTGTLADIQARVVADPNQQRGEIVLIVHGADAGENGIAAAEEERVLRLLLAELPLKQAAELAARITGGSKNSLYQKALAWQKP